MRVRFVRFGEIEIDGRRYERDVVIHDGTVERRRKAPSKPFRDRYGHTPLSVEERIPWRCRRLIVGSGAQEQLPVMDEVRREAARRGVELLVMPTPEACAEVSAADMDTTAAILHVTC